jgi:transposase
MTVVKKNGVKLHIGVDVLGLSHTIKITTANVTDRDGAIEMVTHYRDATDNLEKVIKLLVDGGYTGDNFANSIRSLIGAEVEVAKRSALHKFEVIPKRWIVERTFGWLDKCRRLWKNCKRKLHNTLQMVLLAFTRILLKRY